MKVERLRKQAINYIAVGIRHPKLTVRVYFKDGFFKFYHDLSANRDHYLDFYLKDQRPKLKYTSSIYTVYRKSSQFDDRTLGTLTIPKAEDIKYINIKFTRRGYYSQMVIEINNLYITISKG